MALTESKIRKLKSGDQARLVCDRNGLYLKISKAGLKTWVYRTRKGGKWTVRKLGKYPEVSLSGARSKAAIAAGERLPESVTFSELLQEHFDRRIEPNYRTSKNAVVYVRKGQEWLGEVPLHQLTTMQLTDALAAYADQHAVAANRCLGHWKLALNYAVQRGMITANPLAATTSRVIGGNEKSRERVLDNEEIRALWDSEHKHGSLLRALLLSGCRISELQRASHDDIEGRRLHIRENKSGRPHWIYITELFERQIESTTGKLFTEISPTAVQARLKRVATGWKPHDLRRTFATRLADKGIAPHVISACLNHAQNGMTLAVYARSEFADERIAATQWWADEIAFIVGEGS